MSAIKEIFRFSIAGIVVVAADFSIYYLLIKFLPYSISKAISFTCAGILGYLINKYWVFTNKQSSYAQMVRFFFVNLMALGLNVLINQLGLKVLNFPVWLALLVATGITNIMIFVAFKWWVFKK